MNKEKTSIIRIIIKKSTSIRVIFSGKGRIPEKSTKGKNIYTIKNKAFFASMVVVEQSH